VKVVSGVHRWVLVAVGVTLLVALPFLVRALPVPDRDVAAPDLLTSIRGAGDVAFSGYVESRGGVQLPADDSLESVAKLVGRSGSIRVWWADPHTWRTATLRTTGETDLLHQGAVSLRWVYESKRVTVSPDVPVRLPDSSDVLPNVLAPRVLQGARTSELSRLPAERVAGRTALGLRFTPDDEQASIDHVDVWADERSGLPLRVALYRGAQGPASLDTRFVDLEIGAPDRAALSFTPPPDATVQFEQTVDLAAAADRYADRPVPATLAGLPARAAGVRAVGVYGRGPTVLLAMPLRDGDAESLRHTIRERPGARCVGGDAAGSMAVAAGPLQMLVTREGAPPWLVAGTVTAETAERAAARLVRVVPFSVVAGDGEPQPGSLQEDCR
jgi:outer membrane lipoprotein-sorting protein